MFGRDEIPLPARRTLVRIRSSIHRKRNRSSSSMPRPLGLSLTRPIMPSHVSYWTGRWPRPELCSARYADTQHWRTGIGPGIIMVSRRQGEVDAMANVLIRNLDNDVLKQLKAAAKAHGRSLQAEIHEVLRTAGARRVAETRRLSAQWLRRLRGSRQTDSAALIREDRDTR